MSGGRARGISLLWVIVGMTLFCAIGSLAVDYGRRQVVKSELRRAADAAARAAASNLGQPATARKLASDFALQNSADGQPVVLVTDEDVTFGNWDADKRLFTELTGTSENKGNAVKVATRRTAARGSAVPLMWASLLGKSNCDVEALAIAAVGAESYGVIGLNWVLMKGNSTSSYWSDGAGGAGSLGNVASNGDITLTNGATINGNARSYGGTVSGGTISGSTSPLAMPLSFPPGDAGIYATTNDNNLIPNWAKLGNRLILGKNQSLTAPGGNYYFRDVTTSTGSSLTFLGPTTIYCWGTFKMTSQTATASSLPKNLKIVMCTGPTGQTPGSLTISAGAALYADIYAPQSAVSIGGKGDIYGSVLGLTVEMSGSGEIHYDLSLKGTGGIAIVK